MDLVYNSSNIEIRKNDPELLKVLIKFEDESFFSCTGTSCAIEAFKPGNSLFIVYLMEEMNGHIISSRSLPLQGKLVIWITN